MTDARKCIQGFERLLLSAVLEMTPIIYIPDLGRGAFSVYPRENPKG